MKEELELAVNLFYKEWLKTNDPFEEDFEIILEEKFPNIRFSLSIETSEWLIL